MVETEVSSTQVYEQMGHPVDIFICCEAYCLEVELCVALEALALVGVLEDLVADEVEDPVGDVDVDEDGEGLDGAHVLGLGGRHVGGQAHYRREEHCEWEGNSRSLQSGP